MRDPLIAALDEKAKGHEITAPPPALPRERVTGLMEAPQHSIAQERLSKNLLAEPSADERLKAYLATRRGRFPHEGGSILKSSRLISSHF